MKSSIRLILSFSLMAPVLGGCVTSKAYDQQPTRVYETVKPAQSVTSGSFSQQQLDSLLAPIALYPDSLLSHILIASTYPLEVVEAERWSRNNTRLQGEDAVKAVENQNWDPSIKALVAFPDVLKRMSEDLDWTQQLGDAFLEDEGRVMDSIQNLRDKAYASGHLKDTDHVKVVREERVIMIEPAVERVVYVPVYDTRVVYGPWWWNDYPPVYWHRYSHQVYFSGSFYWGPRVYIGPSFHFSSCHWSNRRVVIIDHHHHRDYYHHRHAYTGRYLAHYEGAQHWNHNPSHRRGVAYYNEPVRARYNSNREPSRNAWDDRQRSRDRAGVISVNPNREQEASRNSNHLERNNRVFENRSDAVRARLSARQQTSHQESTTQVDNRNRNNRWTIGNDEQTDSSNRHHDAVRQHIESRQSESRINRTESTETPAPRTEDSRESRTENYRATFRNRDSDQQHTRQPERETRMENRRESRMEMRRSSGNGNGSSNEGNGRRIIRE